jgi:ferritin
MLDKKLCDLLSDQMNYEFYSAYIYLAMSAYYSSINLNGYASWFKIQAMEERDHALLQMQYMLNNYTEIDFKAIEKPEFEYTAVDQPLMVSLDHERRVTQRIYNIYSVASDLKDYRTTQFLDWFVKEQGEEEKNSENNIKNYQLFGADPKGLFLLDAEMLKRVYMPPTLVL